jgi:hypothetical protein
MSDPVIDLLEDVWVSIIELGEHLGSRAAPT